ncbi:MAG: phosphoribosyltransferase family protein [Armatimonadota bacterium]
MTRPAAGMPAVVCRAPAAARAVLTGLADLLWPPKCCVCERVGSLFFCEECRQTIMPVELPCCPHCGRPDTRSSCPDCGEAPWLRASACDAMRQVALFDSAWRAVIHCYKYDGMRVLADELGAYLTDWLDKASVVWREVDCVAAVPGHFLRRWRLGFEHSRELAARVAGHLDVPLVSPLRRLPGRRQVGLSREERLKNARKIYTLSRDADSVSGRRVLVVDDVVTTGATATAVAELLRSAGASGVRLLALARNL